MQKVKEQIFKIDFRCMRLVISRISPRNFNAFQSESILSLGKSFPSRDKFVAVDIHKLSTNIIINYFNGLQIDDNPLKRLSPGQAVIF